MNKKQRKWRNRILVALAIFAVIFAAEHLLPLADMLGSEAAAVYLLFALYLVPYLIAGHDALLPAPPATSKTARCSTRTCSWPSPPSAHSP